jgi:hypothetical protein
MYYMKKTQAFYGSQANKQDRLSQSKTKEPEARTRSQEAVLKSRVVRL